jgi:6-pyruvoyltetrahydropterin/6-carboxytetrahydropterin synthase
MSKDVFEITKGASFDAAHYLPVGPGDHRYRRMHGHSFRVEATLRGKADAKDAWVADLGELETALGAAAAGLDHSLLNEQPGLETPTLERLCLYFAERLKGDFPGLCRIVVARPSVGESCALTLG